MCISADTIVAQKVQERLKSLYQSNGSRSKEKLQQSDQGINNIIKFQTGHDDYQVNHTVTVIRLHI
jgi:hypothetical protein